MKRLLFLLLLIPSIVSAGPKWVRIDSTLHYKAYISPAIDLNRVQGFSEGMRKCEPCMDEMTKTGFKLLLQLHREHYYGWYAIALDIPDSVSLIFDHESRVIAIQKDSTITESDRIAFALGWNNTIYDQREVFEANDAPVRIRPVGQFGEPTSNDLEWLRANNENLPKYYVVGYVRFGQEVRALNWRIEKVATQTRR